MDEFALIDWIRRQGAMPNEAVAVGPGDDCAVLRIGGEQVLVTADQCADGVHFVLSECGGEAAGYKVMARNLSDIAAMGGEPVAAVTTVTLPKGLAESAAQDIYRGMRRAGDAFGCPVVGGDIAAWDQSLLLTVTMLGRVIGPRPLLRSDARAGDAVCVTGTLGGSLASGKHLTFTPRIEAARRLAADWPIHAMIDLSDGLASDSRHIARESRVGIEIVEAWLPISEAAERSADPVAAAMTDGEDYELLFTLPLDRVEELIELQPLDVPVTWIGNVFEGEGVFLVERSGGRSRRIDGGGWEHSF